MWLLPCLSFCLSLHTVTASDLSLASLLLCLLESCSPGHKKSPFPTTVPEKDAEKAKVSDLTGFNGIGYIVVLGLVCVCLCLLPPDDCIIAAAHVV